MYHNITGTKRHIISSLLIMSVLLSISLTINAEEKKNSHDLLDQYISSKGSQNIIFDSSNIKQFWIDKTVSSKDDSVNILLSPSGANGKESVPLKIQLANVKENQDCRIEIISETKDFSFSVLSNNLKVLSTSKKEDDFLNYSITSSLFHLEDTKSFSFNLKFASKSEDVLSIKKIILSFSLNKTSSFLVSPGKLAITDKTINTQSIKTNVNEYSFSISGKQNDVFSSKKIYVTDNTLSSSVTVKNTGKNSISVSVGYAIYGKGQISLSGNNYPYNKSKTIHVVNAKTGSSTITVDSYPEWRKGGYVALNAKDDYSDIPNTSFLEGRIVEIKKIENEQAEIVLDKPLSAELKPGTGIRVHAVKHYFYTGSKKIAPGEEDKLTATIKKDDSLLEYSSSKKAFPRGTYYVIPFLLFSADDPKVESSILIRDFNISY